MKISVLSSACAILLLASATSIQAIAPVSIAVFPPDVNMQSARGKQRIIVQASYADGITRDVTAQAKVTISDPKNCQDCQPRSPSRRRWQMLYRCRI